MTVHLVFLHVDYVLLDRVVAFSVLFSGYDTVQYMNWKESLLRPQSLWEVAEIPSPIQVAYNG